MKRLFTLITCALITVAIEAQPVNKYIKEKEVSKIINTLASDDMSGRFALVPNDINKAASYIEESFKTAGLDASPGLSDFRQSFQKVKLSRTSLKVIADGQVIADDRIVLSSREEVINLNSSTPIDTIGKQQDFFQTLTTFERQGGNKIVLVAKEHEANFGIARNYLSRAKILDPNEVSTGSTIYLLDLSRPNDIAVAATQSREIITMANIVGVLPGKSRPDEFVIFSAHYDHIGLQQTIEGDSIANGADDDASGTTAVIALAKYFSKLKSNERTLIFAAFTAEEIGGFGSVYFSQQLDPDKVVAMFNIEMIGKPSLWGQNAAFITGFERSDFGKILQKNLEGTTFQVHPDPYPQENLFYRSDNATLARLGVPAHSISTDQIPTDPYYHTVNDEVETLDMANITAAIRGIALSAKTIVDGTDTPTRVNKKDIK